MFARLNNAWNRLLEWIRRRQSPMPLLEDEEMGYAQFV